MFRKTLKRNLAYLVVMAMLITLVVPMGVNAAAGDVDHAIGLIEGNSAWTPISVAYTTSDTATKNAIVAVVRSQATTFLASVSGDGGFDTHSDLGIGTITPDWDGVTFTSAGLAQRNFDFVIEVTDSAVALENDDTDPIVFSVTVTAEAADPGTNPDGTIDGTSTVENVIFQVRLPVNLNFAIDPFEISSGRALGGQIRGGDYFFVNRTTAVDVEIGLTITATLNDNNDPLIGVSLVDNVSELERDDISEKSKKAFFAAVTAQTITTAPSLVADDLFTGMAFGYGTEHADGIIMPFYSFLGGADEGISEFQFALGGATATNLASSNQGIASFTFYGQLNTYANWAANDITVSAAYTLTGLRSTTYAGYRLGGSGFEEDSLNMRTYEAKVAPPTPDDTFTGATLTISDLDAAASQIVLAFNVGNLPTNITSITSDMDGLLTAGTDYTFADGLLIITDKLPDPGDTVTYTIVAVGPTTGFTLTVTRLT
jgi:hypothetical protein